MAGIDVLIERARDVAARDAADVPSPCVSVCRMDTAVQYCVGCWRTLDEIAAWARMGDDEKRAVWAQIEARAKSARAGNAFGTP